MPRFLTRLALVIFVLAAPSLGMQDERPNILWITSEDNGPHLGAYGDAYADTPHLDALARDGLRYLHAWSNAPVCAPARTAIISGLYPTSTGSQHMRSQTRLPAGMKMFPEVLREAGYYCSNRRKEDYNLAKTGAVWDDSSGKAHWRKRPAGQPFFAVFNITVSHESQIRKRPHEPVHDPAEVRVPAYHPDHPDVRRDWAQYHDKVTEMDARAGEVLAQLDADGLRESTIVVYFGDHGSGMPRSKRWPYNSGLHVPLIVSFPERFRALAPEDYAPGGASERLVSFVDLAPTMLSLAGLRPTARLHGRAFCGPFERKETGYAFGFRDRMDERYDLVRSVRDRNYVYVRNFMPHRIYGEYLAYMFETPTTRVWKELYDAGELAPPRTLFWERKPVEELYALASDPDEVDNLIDSAKHAGVAQRMRRALRSHLFDTNDLGFLPEAEMRARAGTDAPYTMGDDPSRYPLTRILHQAELASMDGGEPEPVAWLTRGLADRDSAIRYWSAMGALIRGPAAVEAMADALRSGLADPSPAVRSVCAEALGRHGSELDRIKALAVLLPLCDVSKNDFHATLLALGALDALGAGALPALDKLRALPRTAPGVPGRQKNYVPRLLEKILADLDALVPHPPARRELVYAQRGELELRLFVHEPTGPAPAGGRPAVVFFHGGGWSGGDPSQFFDQCEHLTRRGITGISAEYRLTKKHGTTPFDCVTDGKAALRWVRAHATELGIDPARIAAGGGSAGGHVAAAVATVPGLDDDPASEVSCRPAALLLFNPVFDNGPGGWGHARVAERWREISPLHNIGPETPPTIVFLGTADSLVPVATGERFRDAVRAAGGVCELKLYADQAHGFFNRSRNADIYARTMEDMDAFLSGIGW